MKGSDSLYAFNRGIVSRLALARLDLAKLKLSAEIQANWMPRALGSMMLRPGLGYLGAVASKTRMLPFVFAASDTALIEMSGSLLRVWVDDALLARTASASSIANGTFGSDLANWTDEDQSGATSAWVTGGYMGLTGDGTNAAIRQQLVAAVSGTHALRIVVQRGPVTLRIGSTSLGSEYRRDTTLGTGTHSITVTTTGNFYVQFRNARQRQALVDSVAIEAAGAMTLPTPYVEANLPLLRFFQSGDVVYLACAGYQQRKVERRDDGSWSVVLYQPEDGPFRVQNVGPTAITPSGLSGNITLSASDDLWDAGHVGALWSLTSASQRIETSFSADNVFSDPIRVTGIGESRRFAVVITGTFTATLTLQRSIGDDVSWQDQSTYTAATDTTVNDALDNQIIYYRIGVKTGDYATGTADTTLNYSSGSRTGVVRITAYSSATSVSAEVLTALGGTDATSEWSEGSWSDFRGWPSAVCIHDGGRLWWAGKDKFIGSITDAYESFDPEFEGDAGPISRSIGSGPVDIINWLLPLGRLIAGTDGGVVACRSTSFDEPLTPSNFTPKRASTQGTAQIQALEIDGSGIFVERSGLRVYEMAYAADRMEYAPVDLTAYCPEVCSPGIVGIAVQRQPDTRVHCVLSDGSVAVLIFDKNENLLCWVKVETDGLVEDVCVLPSTPEDAVYYVVRRTSNGVQVRYLERLALESEARGGTSNRIADSFVVRSATGGVITGLEHLETQDVIVWGDGLDMSPGFGADQTRYVVTGGQITGLPVEEIAVACVGRPYASRFKSTKLAHVVEQGVAALTARKRVGMLGVVLADSHAQGLQYGRDFDTMDDLPLIEQGTDIDVDEVYDAYEQPPFTFPGEWTVDARLCLSASAPRPCTVLAAVIDMTTSPRT